MTVDELVEALSGLERKHEQKLRGVKKYDSAGNPVPFIDHEAVHFEADMLLLQFIGDERVSDAFNALERWYS